MTTATVPAFRIERATERDVPLILRLIKGLAEYEKLTDEVRATEDDLRRSLFGPNPAAEVVVGYAGWGPGQLDQEIAASGWLTMDVDPTLIFNTPPDQMWEAALKRLGADPAGLQRSIGVH